MTPDSREASHSCSKGTVRFSCSASPYTRPVSAPAKGPVVPPIDENQLWKLFASADEIGLRLELQISGITWETSPGLRHQELCFAVATSVQHAMSQAPCRSHQVMDVAIRFPNGMVKRPDISIFCERPKEDDGFVHRVPEAAIEIVSPGFEAKDLVYGPPFYLEQGVLDVLVLDRTANQVHHFRPTSHQTYPSPRTFDLECGSSATV